MSEESSPEAPEHGESRLYLLDILVACADKKVNVGVTLSVGGLVVVGEVVTMTDYLRGVAESFAAARGNAAGVEVGDIIADALHAAIDQVPPEPIPLDAKPRTIALRRARIMTGSTVINVGWWCGRVAAVDGFAIGEPDAAR